MTSVAEPRKQIPVRTDVGVVVAGAGVAGVFAALGAARAGARTALVERFGSVGGNIGPGMIVNGHMISGRAHDKVRYECSVYPQLYGLGREFLDRYGEFRALRYTADHGQPLWVDMPYRVMLPRGLDGMLAVGRSASGTPDTLLRNRMACKVMGQAGGTAAALAAARGETPRQLDVRALQERLLDDGFYLGDRFRLRELGLV